jgi:hypothetical protein
MWSLRNPGNDPWLDPAVDPKAAAAFLHCPP